MAVTPLFLANTRTGKGAGTDEGKIRAAAVSCGITTIQAAGAWPVENPWTGRSLPAGHYVGIRYGFPVPGFAFFDFAARISPTNTL